MKNRKLGSQGLEVSEIGLGCMGMTYAYGRRDDVESMEAIAKALDLGVTLFDTAEVYGPYSNEEVLGKGLGSRRQRVSVATKFGFRLSDGRVTGLDSSPANIRKVVDASLQRLGTDYIDLLYQHRVDPNVPIEEVAGTVRDIIAQGKARYFGLSEAGVDTVRRAHAVCPVSAVQVEYSLWARGAERTLAPALEQLGIGLVAYSPLGRGFLVGSVNRPEDLDKLDYRTHDPRMMLENFDRNRAITQAISAIAAKVGATPAQVCIAWVLCANPHCVPIPGTKRAAYISQNVGAADVHLAKDDLRALNDLLDQLPVAGDRYPGKSMTLLDTDF